MRVAIYAVGAGGGFANKRSKYIAAATQQGLLKHGISTQVLNRFDGVVADVAIAYGWIHRDIFHAYRDAGARFAYWDLGYWNRRPKNAPSDGHHRLAVDDWDTAAKMIRDCPSDRFEQLGIEIRDRQAPGENILVAGMSDKAAWTHGYAYNEWEDRTVLELSRMAPGQSIVLRPKPNKRAPAATSLESDLNHCKLLVTHHSNAAVDALLTGVPMWAKKGVASLLASPELTSTDLAHPGGLYPHPEAVRGLMHDIAYAQWSVPEMRSGAAWEHIRRILCA